MKKYIINYHKNVRKICEEMSILNFTKMQGLGNDYIYVDCFKEKIENPKELACSLSDRHFGIGSDGLILIKPSNVADFMMEMYNADGSQSEMCGNGIRCVGKYVYDFGLTTKTDIAVETLAGIKRLKLHIEHDKVNQITVDMGEPILKPQLIPLMSDKECYVNETIEIFGRNYNMTGVSMGNPHGVIFVKDVKNFSVETVGKALESHPIFPQRANIEFVEVLNKTTASMRVWERGSGETLACGTGTCASVVAGVLNNLLERKTTVHLLGGDLHINWNEEDNHVYMTGSATTVFTGCIEL